MAARFGRHASQSTIEKPRPFHYPRHSLNSPAQWASAIAQQIKLSSLGRFYPLASWLRVHTLRSATLTTNNPEHVLFGDGDELPSNPCDNPHMRELINDVSRRQVLAGGASLGALAFFGVGMPSESQASELAEHSLGFPFKPRSRLPFSSIAIGRADTISVPPGYKATPFIPWGTPTTGRHPAFLDDASNSAQDQAEQIGMHHDGPTVVAGKRSSA
jgi:hypothetical protein